MTNMKRPLSPHLGVWKWTPTMAMSILHRATGVANSVGLVMIVVWLVSAASGPEAYAQFLSFSGSLIGLLLYFGWTLSIYIHLLSGIRHLIMDTGRLLDVRSSTVVVLLIWVLASFLTTMTWLLILGGNS